MESMDNLIEVMRNGYVAAGEDAEIIPVTVNLPADMVAAFGSIARNQGKPLDDFVKESVEYRTAYYISNRATGVWKDGAYLPNMTPLEIEDAARKGVNIDDERVPCKVVCKRKIFGEPYFQIFRNGNFLAVPAAQVKVYENESLFDGRQDRVV